MIHRPSAVNPDQQHHVTDFAVIDQEQFETVGMPPGHTQRCLHANGDGIPAPFPGVDHFPDGWPRLGRFRIISDFKNWRICPVSGDSFELSQFGLVVQ